MITSSRPLYHEGIYKYIHLQCFFNIPTVLSLSYHEKLDLHVFNFHDIIIGKKIVNFLGSRSLDISTSFFRIKFELDHP